MPAITIADLRSQASQVNDGAELDTITLVRLDFTIGEASTEQRINVENNLIVRGIASGRRVQALGHYWVSAQPEGAPDDDAPFVWRVLIEVSANYLRNEEADFAEQDLDAFALMIGAPALHPYAREVLQSITARSPFPAYTLGQLIALSSFPDDQVLELEPPDLDQLRTHA